MVELGRAFELGDAQDSGARIASGSRRVALSFKDFMCPFGCMEQVQQGWVERLKGCLLGCFRYLELILGVRSLQQIGGHR